MKTCFAREVVMSVLLMCPVLVGVTAWAEDSKVLVYTRNFTSSGKGFVHDNIGSCVAMLKTLGSENGFAVEVSEDPAVFTDAGLKKYRAVIFANSNNEAFADDAQREAFQRFIRAGGGFVGIHSACGSERKWPWFWALIGGTFERHPKLQPFTIKVVDRKHPSTAHLGDSWQWTDEFYFLKEMPADLDVLLEGDLSSLVDPKKPGDRKTAPLAWCHEFEGGRSWYTALGHKKEHYADADLKKHILGGILWAMGRDTKVERQK